MLTTDLPTETVAISEDAGRTGLLQANPSVHGSITRRPGTIQSGPLTALRAPARWSREARVPGVVRARHPSAVRCRRLTGRDHLPRAASQFIQLTHRPQPQVQQHPGQLITALACEPGRAVPQCHYLLGKVSPRYSLMPK
jgi:hypothetical protein